MYSYILWSDLAPCGWKNGCHNSLILYSKSVFMSSICYDFIASQSCIYQCWISKINKIKYEIRIEHSCHGDATIVTIVSST